MQQVRLYYNLKRAQSEMTNNINNGWRVHTCSVSCYVEDGCQNEKVLVVYEKDNELSNKRQTTSEVHLRPPAEVG